MYESDGDIAHALKIARCLSVIGCCGAQALNKMLHKKTKDVILKLADTISPRSWLGGRQDAILACSPNYYLRSVCGQADCSYPSADGLRLLAELGLWQRGHK